MFDVQKDAMMESQTSGFAQQHQRRPIGETKSRAFQDTA